MQDVYIVKRNDTYHDKWDVVRNAPTVISTELKQVEAAALAFALNAQLARLEGRSGEPR